MSLASSNLRCIPFDNRSVDPRPLEAHDCNRQKLALVIPTIREAGNICVLLERVCIALEQIGSRYEIIVVDDDSRDGTAEIVTAIAEHDSRVRLLVRKGQRGLSGAVLHGWHSTDATILGAMDADLQHPPELLPLLASVIFSGCDLAIGSRYSACGGLGRWNPARRLVSAAAIWIAAPIQRAGLRVRDPMSGYFFVRRRCLDGIAFQPEGFKLLLEILARGRIRSVREIPFVFGRRRRGTSKANMQVAWDYLRLLASLYCGKLAFGRRKTIPIESLERQEAD